MKILLTGGSGDLGKVLACRLEKRGNTVLRFDIRKPVDAYPAFIEGSILDRQRLAKTLPRMDCIVHIAAWHGYHEFTQTKNIYEFWDLNVTGTLNVFQAALEAKVDNIVFISSEAVADRQSIYGWTKILGEEIAQRYSQKHGLNVLTLRPRAFIPYWNKEVYQSFVDWGKWFWKGAVHINDVAQAVIQGIDLLSTNIMQQHLILPVDGAYEYTPDDLLHWDQSGHGSTFKKYYAKYYELAIQHGFDPGSRPTMQDISATRLWLGYEPRYSLMNLLEDLSTYGGETPPTSYS